MQVTVKHLKYISGGPAPLAAEFAEAFNTNAEAFGFNSVRRVVEFLAQIAVENRFQYRKEIWGPTATQLRYEGREDLGNTQAGDGKKFIGRGPMQLTGRANYAQFTTWLRKRMPGCPDFTKSPQLLEQLQWGILSAFFYWETRKLNALADRGDTKGITKKVNGGYNHLAERQAAAKRGYTVITNDVLGHAEEAPEVALTPLIGPATIENLTVTNATISQAPDLGSFTADDEEEDAVAPTKEKLKTVQQLLFQKGYKDVGDDDGKWGTKTDGALALFRRDHNLPRKFGYAQVDSDLLNALFDSEGRGANAGRAGLRLPDIATKVPEVMAANLAKKISGAGIGLAGLPAVVGTIAAGIPDARNMLDPIINAVNFTMPTWGWLVILTGISAGTFYFSRRSERAGVDAYRNGERNAQS